MLVPLSPGYKQELVKNLEGNQGENQEENIIKENLLKENMLSVENLKQDVGVDNLSI